MFFGVSMMQKGAVMTSRRSDSAAFDVKLINQHLVGISFKLMFVRDDSGLVLIVSQGSHIRQVTFDSEEVGDDVQSFLAVQDPSEVATRVISNLNPQELDMDRFFLEVVKNLHGLYRKNILDEPAMTQHLEELVYWRESCDPEACITYLHLENLSDVVEDSKIYQVKPEEVHFWHTIWKAVVNKSSALNAK